ncbi:arylsulfatase [Agromyces bracchium]|uniref:Sulfatase-like hydrolase/transferase n=1 Tax=Agromyces bracchium TaxID=88376 RepID=A0A6I3M529_9MICO|nr:arylsulfatase [Agromyces bracchium]MTH68011.1 sulfatase-like hydrolase/transferase [Agromyces bracchium]
MAFDESEGPDRYRLPIGWARAAADTPVDARDATKPAPAAPLRPPAGAPNVLIILIDDMGFGASSAFGGPCEMPVAERVAAEGTRFTRFHTTALCSPTRQALLTGRNHHTAEMGALAEVATSFPGYTGVRPDDCATLGQVLRMNGYSTGMFGKHHQTPPWETSPSGPFDRWPTGEGFEKFYGFIGGDTHQWVPALVDGTRPIEPPRTPEEGYHLSEDLVDQAIAWLGGLDALTPDKPWFTYLSFGATHAPHHVPKRYLDAVRGRFDHGYDRERELTFERQRELGVIPPDAELTAPNEKIPAWDDLEDDDRLVGTRLFEAYAAMATHTDEQVGRLLDALEEQGVLDDTLVFYILGDNGASAEAGAYGTFNEMAYQNNVLMTTADITPRLDDIGGPKAFNHMPSGWAHAMNTPYQWSKIVASHWGGTRTGMIVRYPGRVPAGERRSQFTHVIDIVPTILEYAGLPEPAQVNGVPQRALEGVSFKYAVDDSAAAERHHTQYFEIGGNRGIYHDGWTAVTQHWLPWPDPDDVVPALADDTWELYGPDDWTQAHDLAAEQPDKLAELQQRFLIEGAKYNVLPIDDRQRERFDPVVAGRPDLMRGRTRLTLRPGMSRLNENTVLNVKNRSFTVTAVATLPTDGPAQGALVAQGGSFGGWALYFRDGLLGYAHNFVGMHTSTVRSAAPVRGGEHVLEMRFDYDGGGAGKGGEVTLLCDGEPIGSGRVDRTVPGLFSFDEGMDIGCDSLDPVVEDYLTPRGEFTGTIATVTIDIAPDAEHDPDLVLRARYRKQ